MGPWLLQLALSPVLPGQPATHRLAFPPQMATGLERWPQVATVITPCPRALPGAWHKDEAAGVGAVHHTVFPK